MNDARCNRSTLLKKGRVFDFYSENITLSNGVTLDMELIRHPGAAAIVALTEDRSVLLLQQYRYAAGGIIWEIPAGTLDPAEDPDTCAARELTEETGYRAHRLEKLGQITPLPAYSNERIHLYLATGLEKAAQHLDEDEVLSVHRRTLDQALQMIADGTIQDAKTIAALHLTAGRLARG
jgi:ADP-ribose pyrophosphatase